LSHRRLIQVFTAEVGMTPKLFGRIQRFQRALHAAQAVDAPDWAGLALGGKYCDQAHLIRDFVAFSGLSPTELSRRGSVAVKANHVAVP
jgi:AraC-like DNA-binding protein